MSAKTTNKGSGSGKKRKRRSKSAGESGAAAAASKPKAKAKSPKPKAAKATGTKAARTKSSKTKPELDAAKTEAAPAPAAEPDAAKTEAATGPAAEPDGARVAVCDTDPSHARTREILEALGYRVVAATDADAIASQGRDGTPPIVAVVALPEQAELARSIRAATGPRPTVLGSLAGPSTTAPARASDADLFALRPHSPESLAPVLHAATVLHDRREEIRTLRATAAASARASSRAGFQPFEFFQRFLITEIKRAKRFGYSLAVALVSPDEWPGGVPAPATRQKADRELTAAIGACIRDIDLPVDYADDRLLLFLPYTDLEGAQRVGERVARAVVDRGVTDAEGVVRRRTVSIGIAALKPGKPVSFARLMRDANAALKAAKLKGGGRVVVRT